MTSWRGASAPPPSGRSRKDECLVVSTAPGHWRQPLVVSLSPLLLLLLLAGTFPATALGAAWLQVDRPCSPGCEERGNCNRELGVCECNFGWVGDSCDQPILGACRSSDSPTALVGYGKRWPKNCECWRQLARLLWDQERQDWSNLRLAPQAFAIKFCYERDGVPAERQFSDIPDPSDSDMSFYKVYTDTHAPDLDSLMIFSRIQNPEHVVTNDHLEEPLLPLSSCPDRCLDRGVCYQHDLGDVWPGPQQGPRCTCRKGLTGPSCNEHDNAAITSDTVRIGDQACRNKCSGRGECFAGFCKCETGYWGIDCSRSKAYAPDPSLPNQIHSVAYNRTALRIYKYELPWHIAFPAELDDGMAFIDYAYSTDDRFNERFSSDWAVRTENPYEANLFYVPAMAVYMAGQERQDVHVHRVMAYIKATYPDLWARNEGRDHFIILPQDMGACYMNAEDHLNEAPIKVVHFGLHISHDRFVDMPGKHAKSHRQYGCFHPRRDVVIPHADVKPGNFETSPEAHARLANEAMEGTPPRENLLFFGGSIRQHQKAYSGGARQAFFEYVLERHDPRVKYGGLGYDEYWRASFCFNPYGDGYGNRLPHILLGGCVPVTVQEHVHQPFDDIIPYDEFGLVLHLADIPRLLETLEAIPQQKILEYRRAALKYNRAFYWGDDGQAYSYLLRSLFHRLQNLWAGVF
uniref:EGF-like domain-containing protein n=1 Tax=Chlamydomonas euryale TaxID=1486919 RepID=A0A7R9YSL4_9CHLO|mmetsp:Transcript_20719/g.61882  ORF Transcript_20719/g.61882 Transcript_20719/m.61882 type:complete len:689 (+) Transcript_20719:269-2335(+)